ncbi:hypothetical protein [Acinetobacter puyangensis]|uniref:hypothetical protein n=1 Tax=Acinetobacter puyangensis TaxID=1096779 RepID=UPI003A4D1D42
MKKYDMPRANYVEYIDEIRAALNNYDLLNLLSNEEYHHIISSIKIKKYLHNQIIYKQNEVCQDIVIIITGSIKYGWISANGKNSTQLFVPPGSIIGLTKQEIADAKKDAILA